MAQRRHLPHRRRPRRRRRGQQRFAPLNSWPDNANLDKARRLLWPIKQKYGRKISWADLMVLAGNVALESMGFKTFGFGGGREDVWEPEHDLLGPGGRSGSATSATAATASSQKPLARRADGPDLRQPGGPERQAGSARRRAATSARRSRRMAMNDEETVALIAGGHTFGKTHGAGDRRRTSAPSPRPPSSRSRASAGRTASAPASGGDTITSGLEGAWTTTPTKWDNDFFENLFGYEWELTKSPAGAQQWTPKDGAAARHGARRARPVEAARARSMLTTDLALRIDPAYEPISRRFHENPEEFADAFARAWFKLTHRDMGPHRALPRPRGARRSAALAGPGPGRRSRARSTTRTSPR